MIRFVVVVAQLLPLLVARLVAAEMQVNTYTTSSQYNPAVASDGNGSFVVVWSSAGSAGTDADSLSIQGQRYDATGTPQGGQFQINEATTSTQTRPAVAMSPAGDFVVVWDGNGGEGAEALGSRGIHGRRFDGSGSPQGAQFQVNGYTTDEQETPAVAMDAAGNFVVVWSSRGSAETDTDSWSIHGQRFDAAGTPQGGEFQVNTYTTYYQNDPMVAADAAGGFLVVWESRGSAGSDTSLSSIQGRHYDGAGIPLGADFQVNSYTTDPQRWPAVAMDSAGNFVVVWSSYASAGSDSSLFSIQGQRFDSAGTTQGGQFQVNSYTTNGQIIPQVAMDDAGEFTVVWTSGFLGGAYDVKGQRYDNAGVPQGAEFQAHSLANDQSQGVIAATDTGSFVVAWTSEISAGSDTSGLSVQWDRFLPGCSGPGVDGDGDAVCDYDDTCALAVNPDQRDEDGDGAGDVCDPCPQASPDTCNQSQSTGGTVGASGGTLTTPDNSISVQVPAGTFSSPTSVSITGGLPGSEYGVLTPALRAELGPEGLTFSPPITVTFIWKDVDGNGVVDGTSIAERTLHIYRNGVPLAGTTMCGQQPCTAAACCDQVNNRWIVQLSQFSEYTLATSGTCTPAVAPSLKIANVAAPAGDDRLVFKGSFVTTPPVGVALDLVANGAEIRLVDSPTVVLDVQLPPGAFDPDTRTGWKQNGTGTKWTYVGPRSGTPGGIRKAVFIDRSSTTSGLVAFRAIGRAGSYGVSTAVAADVIPTRTGQCVRASFESPAGCVLVGPTLRCE